MKNNVMKHKKSKRKSFYMRRESLCNEKEIHKKLPKVSDLVKMLVQVTRSFGSEEARIIRQRQKKARSTDNKVHASSKNHYITSMVKKVKIIRKKKLLHAARINLKRERNAQIGTKASCSVKMLIHVARINI